MKLLFCPQCGDMRKLQMKRWTKCKCGKSQGRYTDDITAQIKGYTIPIGVRNYELGNALNHSPHQAYDTRDQFTGWIIAEPCQSVKRVK